MNHDQKICALVEQIKARKPEQGPIEFAKKSVSHMVPNPAAEKERIKPLDLKSLDEILSIDRERRIAVAEPGVTFHRLVEATVPLGLIPTTVPELKEITLGGAVSGCSIESMSYKLGSFHDSCLEYEVVTGTGEVLTCSPEKDPDLFGAMFSSYGTLGIITKLTFRLLECKPFVRLNYERFTSFKYYWSFLKERIQAGDVDFIDGIIHAPDQLVACLGTMVDEAPRISNYEWLNIYYKSTATKPVDYLPISQYFFRYDTECHWLSRTVPVLENKAVRLLFGKIFLGSTNMLKWSKRLSPIFRLQRRPDVVVDVFIPESHFERFFDWYAQEIDHWPLWIVPFMAQREYRAFSDAFHARGHRLFIDCAIYGKPNNHPEIDYSQLLEQKTYELEGMKTLISRNHHDLQTFWSVYSQPRWEAIKARTDPNNLFGDLYQRMHPAERKR
ncbi:MAG: FAD-binding oxidoreductase [Bradymonadales bacterium]|nr:FAD-binding oxidoreductase [Bradymonadales bacterium]